MPETEEYKCKACGEVFSNRKVYRKHLNEEHR